jgi:hypothetical protein
MAPKGKILEQRFAPGDYIHPMWHSAYKAYAFARDENGTKLPVSPAIERFAMAFEKNVLGPTVLTQIPVLDEPILDIGN